MPIKVSIGEAIGILRRNAGLTQLEFGYMINRSHKTICNWKNNRGEPNLKEISIIYEIFKDKLPDQDISLEWLFGVSTKEICIDVSIKRNRKGAIK